MSQTIVTWDEFDQAVEAGLTRAQIRDMLPAAADYDELMYLRIKRKCGIVQKLAAMHADPPGATYASIGPADPTPPSPPRSPYQNGYGAAPRPTAPTRFNADELIKKINEHTHYIGSAGPRTPAKAICRCDIKDLMSSGHTKGCPEKKR